LALQEAARKLGIYLGKKKKAALQTEKRSTFVKYIPEIVDSLHKITNVPKEMIQDYFSRILNTKIEDLSEKIEAMQDEDYVRMKDKSEGKAVNDQDSDKEGEQGGIKQGEQQSIEDIENIFLEAKKAREERQKLLFEIKEKEKKLNLD